MPPDCTGTFAFIGCVLLEWSIPTLPTMAPPPPCASPSLPLFPFSAFAASRCASLPAICNPCPTFANNSPPTPPLPSSFPLSHRPALDRCSRCSEFPFGLLCPSHPSFPLSHRPALDRCSRCSEFPFGLLCPSHRPALNRILSSLSTPVWQNQSTSSCGIMSPPWCIETDGMFDMDVDRLLQNCDEMGRTG